MAPKQTIRDYDGDILGNQHGQSSVLVVAMVGIVLVSFVFLFRSGQITSAKMEMQNGADAAAYGAVVLEARSLNFAAYTNRAMVANEVAIGQMVGMLSWADELESVDGYLQVYVAALGALDWIPGVGEVTIAISEVLEDIGADFLSFGEDIKSVLDDVAGPAIKGLSLVNETYSSSQQIYHLATVALQTTTILKSIEDNIPGSPMGRDLVTDLVAPGDTGAHLSNLGLIAFAGHLPSYFNGFTHRYKPDTNSGKKAGENRKGMGRMAATVRMSRDPFSSSVNHGRGWDFGFKFGVKILEFRLEAISRGGSELRFKNKQYIWSAMDTAVGEGSIKISIPLIYHKKFAIDLPLASGSSQAKGAGSGLNLGDMPYALGHYGKPVAYAGAAGKGHRIPWDIGAAEIGEKSVADNPYKGLQPYRDVVQSTKKKTQSLIPFTAPYFFIGLVRKMDDIRGDAPRFGNELNLKPGTQHNHEMAVISRAEVYFSRPSTLSYFKRLDKNLEKPNSFSPFWQARLVDISDTDRFLALALQQKRIWLDGSDQAAIPGMKRVVKILEDILNKVL